MVWFGSYVTFERITVALVGVMFVTIVGAAAVTAPNLGEIVLGLRPILPDDSLINILALAGGVGGTITLAAYGYWLREKGWSTPRFMKVMRIDNSVAYAVDRDLRRGDADRRRRALLLRQHRGGDR